MEAKETFDFVIVGAGSAGCVLANRLTEDGRHSVMVLEAGGSDRHPFVAAPAGFIKTIDHPGFNWCFKTEPNAATKDREILFPRGRVLGGSSAINGHLYVRGQPKDYDTWAQAGNLGWSYEDVLPYFKKSETRPEGDAKTRGTEGPVHVSDIHERHPLSEAFIAGVQSLGISENPDYNGRVQEGVAYYQRTIRNGTRHSAATAYLRPVIQRRNLIVTSEAMVQRLSIEDGRCTGVLYHRHGSARSAHARHSVILSAGAIGSPHLLQVSGIGPGTLLQTLGVPVVHELPGVGENLRDHFAVRTACRVTQPITLNERARGWRLGWEITKWVVARRGLLAFSPAHVAVFHRSADHLETPDLQFVFTPASYSDGMIGQLQPFPGMTAGVWQMRPESRGYVRARTPNPDDAPAIQPNYLDAPEDQRAIVSGLQWSRRFMQTDAMSPYMAEETLPGPDVVDQAALLDYAQARGATVYHAMGTCRMGIDPMAVVDRELRVHGIKGLRVIDASVMPTMPSANTNAATLMIAEKGADIIRQSIQS